MSGRFAGKIALVTGAASGIGAAFARHVAAEGGAGLALLDRNGEALGALVADLQCPTHVMAGDVGDPNVWAQFEADVARHPVRRAWKLGDQPGQGIPIPVQ